MADDYSTIDREREDMRLLAVAAHRALAHGRFEEPEWRRLRDALQPYDSNGYWQVEKSPELSDDDLAALLWENRE